MPIVSVNFRSIEAENKEKTAENINVNSTPSIKGVKKHDKLFGIQNLIAIDYVYETKYDPNVGRIVIEGDVLYTSEKADKIVEDWEKNRKLDDDMAVDVMNAIFRRCLAKAIEIAADVRLPPPIRFPNVVKQEPEKK